MQTLAAGHNSAISSVLASLPENLDELLVTQMTEEDRRSGVEALGNAIIAHRGERLFINDGQDELMDSRDLSAMLQRGIRSVNGEQRDIISKPRRPGLIASLISDEYSPMIFDRTAIEEAQKQKVFNIDDCPNEMPWKRSGLQLLCDHLQIVRELLLQEPSLFAGNDGKVTSRSVTTYVAQNCGTLLNDLRQALGILDYDFSGTHAKLIPEQIKWEVGDQLTAYGFAVGYDKANDVLTINVGQWSILF